MRQGMPTVLIIGVVFSIWLITFLTPETWARFAVWFVIGMVVYFAYSKRNSVIGIPPWTPGLQVGEETDPAEQSKDGVSPPGRKTVL